MRLCTRFELKLLLSGELERGKERLELCVGEGRRNGKERIKEGGERDGVSQRLHHKRTCISFSFNQDKIQFSYDTIKHLDLHIWRPIHSPVGNVVMFLSSLPFPFPMLFLA